jgi:hypothetical protein
VRGLTKWSSFSGSVLFAALAAGGVLPWLLVARPIAGAYAALALYLVATVAAYLGAAAPERPRGLVATMLAAVAGVAVACVARSVTELAIGLGIVLAVGRSVFLYGRPRARAVVVESLLVGGGLLFARFLAGRSAFAIVLPLWGFFLVQSLYFVAGDVRAFGKAGGHPDPFEDARARALALLDG